MDETTLRELSELFLALSDKTRLRLLGLMADGEVSVGFLADSLGESQPKISRHLAYLRSAGLVTTRRNGKWIYYCMRPPSHPAARNALMAAMGGTYRVEPPPREAAPALTDDDDTYVHADINEWHPEEIEVYLL